MKNYNPSLKNLNLFVFRFFTIFLYSFSHAQESNLKRLAVIGFYNVENLWDTIPSIDYIDTTLPHHHINFHRSIPEDSLKYLEYDKNYKGKWNYLSMKGKKVVRKQINSREFTPDSPRNYNHNVYYKKLGNTAKVISELGYKYTQTAPAVVGLVEIENRNVLEDLIQQDALKPYDYSIVHYNSFDPRGIDVALIYQKKRFTVTKSRKREIILFNKKGNREYTRDILIVEGILDGERFAFFVNHWPSRRGGEAASMPKRIAAAHALKEEMDALKNKFPNIKLISLGDFNDDPVSPSITEHLKAKGNKTELSSETPYFNPTYNLYRKGVATLAYQDTPNLFDQIIYSKNLVFEDTKGSYLAVRTEVYTPKYLINKEGNYKGYPYRSWNGDRFTGGYSDHFPIFVLLQKDLN